MFLLVDDNLVMDTEDLTLERVDIEECRKYGLHISIGEYGGLISLDDFMEKHLDSRHIGEWYENGLIKCNMCGRNGRWQFGGTDVVFGNDGSGLLTVNGVSVGHSYYSFKKLCYMHRSKDGVLYLRCLNAYVKHLLIGVAPDGSVLFFIREGEVLYGSVSLGMKAWLACMWGR